MERRKNSIYKGFRSFYKLCSIFPIFFIYNVRKIFKYILIVFGGKKWNLEQKWNG